MFFHLGKFVVCTVTLQRQDISTNARSNDYLELELT